MAGGPRVDGVEYAQRVNEAAVLVEDGVPAARAARILADRFAVSLRQGRRYVDQASAGGRVPVPEASVVFTVKVPASLVARVRERARVSHGTISAVVTAALEEFLAESGHGRPVR